MDFLEDNNIWNPMFTATLFTVANSQDMETT